MAKTETQLRWRSEKMMLEKVWAFNGGQKTARTNPNISFSSATNEHCPVHVDVCELSFAVRIMVFFFIVACPHDAILCSTKQRKEFTEEYAVQSWSSRIRTFVLLIVVEEEGGVRRRRRGQTGWKASKEGKENKYQFGANLPQKTIGPPRMTTTAAIAQCYGTISSENYSFSLDKKKARLAKQGVGLSAQCSVTLGNRIGDVPTLFNTFWTLQMSEWTDWRHLLRCSCGTSPTKKATPKQVCQTRGEKNNPTSRQTEYKKLW